jgi:hypothetical protein
MKNLNIRAFLLISVASFVPDVTNIILDMATNSIIVPYHLRQSLIVLYEVPWWKGIVFGLSFATAVTLVTRNIIRNGINEVAGMAMICPLLMFVLPILLGFAAPVFKAFPIGPFADLLLPFLYAFFISIVAGVGMHLQLKIEHFLCAGLVGATISALNFIPNLPFSPDRFWYFGVGTFIGWFVSRIA